ncbi:MAG: transposase [Candidatus Omnitrophica bacterium]|nr:transposase [Candidatus Omnitrophota bacterium]
MGRDHRLHYPGAIYHIINRGNNRQAIFLESADQRHYLRCLYHYKKKYKFQLYAFCLMTNHVHLLLRVSEWGTVSKIMQSLTVAYNRWYNFKYKSSGHVWQGRFSSSLVSDDEYLFTAMQYIEQNPLRAMMVNNIGDYLFSSYRLNAHPANSRLIDRNKNPAFQLLGSDEPARCLAYQGMMSRRLDGDHLKSVRKTLEKNGEYMSESFRKQREAILPKKRRLGRPRKAINP